jgi:hypothetical protein
MRRAIAILLVVPALGQDAREIIRRSLERDFTNFERSKNYTYLERQEEREYDAKGQIKKSTVETNEILILAGRPYERLVARDDKPLPEKETRKEQEKMDRALEKRQNISASEQAKLEKERAENRKFLREATDAFHFRLLGVDAVAGKKAWMIEAEPNKDYRPRDARAKVLTRVRGKIWIDEGEYQWVKAEMEVVDTLTFGLSLLRIGTGSTIRFEQTRVNDEIWLPTRINIKGNARLAYVKKMRTEIDVTYKDYRKFQVESRILAEESK